MDEQLIRQELQRRLQANQQRANNIDQLNRQFEAVTPLPKKAERGLKSTLSLVDQLTGSNLASTVENEPSPRDIIKQRLYAQGQQPKERVDGLIGLLNRNQQADRRLAARNEVPQGGKELSQSTIKKLNEGNAIPSMLSNLSGLIEEKRDVFGPVVGRARSLNVYDTEAKAIDAEMRAKSQAFGRFMEGGVLRKEDEEKYRRMFPSLSDTPDVAQKKLEVVQDLLEKRQKSDIDAFKNQGFNVRGLEFQGGQKQQQPSGSLESMSDEDLMRIINGN
jgi:hypothetical protein